MTDTAPAPLALLDRDHLNAMTGGDQSLAIEVIEIFRHQAEIWSRLLDPMADASQWADAAHTLKGASLGIGALRLASICEKAERLGRGEASCRDARRCEGYIGRHAGSGRAGRLRTGVAGPEAGIIAAKFIGDAPVDQRAPDRLRDGR